MSIFSRNINSKQASSSIIEAEENTVKILEEKIEYNKENLIKAINQQITTYESNLKELNILKENFLLDLYQ